MSPIARLAGLAAALLLVAPSAAPFSTDVEATPASRDVVSSSLGSVSPSVEAGPASWEANPANQGASPASQEAPGWQAVHIDSVRAMRAEHGRPWQEFMRSPDLFAGLYEIPAGGRDEQRPHDADEVYYVLEGRGTLVVDGDRYEAGPGSVIFVAKEKDHRFVDITEDLSVLVFFATPGGGGDG